MFICVLTCNSLLYADPGREKTVIFDMSGSKNPSFELFNPYAPGSNKSFGWHQTMEEPLFMSHLLTGEIESWLGQSMTPNSTADVWTLKINPKAKWSDGEDFDADDVIFSINLALDNNDLGGVGSGAVRTFVKNVVKSDKNTVIFNLKQPNPRFQMDIFSVKIWGSFAFVPEHIWKDKDPLTFTFFDKEKGWPVYTGPYTLTSASESEFIFDRNDSWWGVDGDLRDLPAPERVVYTWRGPEETRTAAMVANELDGLHDISPGAYQALKMQNPNVIAWTEKLPFAHIEPTCTRTLEFMTRKEPWNDPDMRWAINYAINRDQIVNIAYEGATVKSRTFFPISQPLEKLVDKMEDVGLFKKYPMTLFDPAKTESILQNKGYKKNNRGYYAKDDRELKLPIIVHEAYIEKLRWTQVVAEQLQDVGINATTTAMAGGTWYEKLVTGDYVASGGWQTCGSTSEPWSSLDNFNAKWSVPDGQRANNNFWRWENQEFSDIVDEMSPLRSDDPKVEKLFLQAMEIYMRELPVIATTQARKLTPYNTTYWKGWPTKKNPYTSPTDWWQNTHVIIHNLEPVN